jgi:predicted transport protein
MYNTRLKNYTLEKLENDNHLNAVTIDWTNISIEHIFPETENLKPHWQAILWENWKELQKENVHRIWNLTITKWSYNSKMSDLPFLEKINVMGWIRASHYRLSDDVVEKKKWDLSDIEERSNKLAEQSLHIWSYPTVSNEKLEEYKDVKTTDNQKVVYTDIDHLQKMDSAIYAIYEKYEEFILSLDWIEKVIKKLYIAYKYEWNNIVEIKPRMKNFHLMIDLPYEEIEDPADFIDNVEWIWLRGTWTSRVIVDSMDNFEYVKWLIIKSLEYAKENELE